MNPHWSYAMPVLVCIALTFWGAYLKSFDKVKLSHLRLTSAGLPMLFLYSGGLLFYFEIATQGNPYPVPTGIFLMILGLGRLIYVCLTGRKNLEEEFRYDSKPTFNPHD